MNWIDESINDPEIRPEYDAERSRLEAEEIAIRVWDALPEPRCEKCNACECRIQKRDAFLAAMAAYVAEAHREGRP